MKKSTLEKLMPIGSVLTLNSGEQKFMIIGRAQVEVNTEKTFDYSACLYPQGVNDSKDVYMFQQEDIDLIFFVGLQDSDEFRFRDYLEEQLTILNLIVE